MKRYVWFFTLLTVLAVGLLGCSSKNKNEVDTEKLQKSFQNAEPSISGGISKAVVAIQSDDYAAALDELKKVAAQAKLTPEQKQAVQDAIQAVTKKMGDAASKAVGDLQKSMPK